MIAPRGGFFTRDGKWAVENEGTAPDIDVENWPKDVIAGRDPQLERAVDEALRLLKEKPVDGGRPNRRRRRGASGLARRNAAGHSSLLHVFFDTTSFETSWSSVFR